MVSRIGCPTGQDIISHVWERLATPEGLVKVQARRRVIEQLRDARQQWLGAGRKLRIHKPGVLTIDQTRMKRAIGGLVAKVLVHGNHVADVEFDPKTPTPRFLLLDARVSAEAVPEREIAWSNDDASSRKIGAILRACEALPAGSSELQIQLELVARLDGSKTADPELAGIRPVKPFGLPTEIATSINLEGDIATGNMDILARTHGGRRRSDGGDFVVLELKRPSLKSRDVPGALQQAIQYAAALTIEANALIGGPRENAALAYRQLFSNDPRSDATKYQHKPLVAHAVAVLPMELESAAGDALSDLALERPLIVHAEHPPIRVGVLLFSAEQRTAKGPWRLASGAHAFRWLRHPGAWTPTQHGR